MHLSLILCSLIDIHTHRHITPCNTYVQFFSCINFCSLFCLFVFFLLTFTVHHSFFSTNGQLVPNNKGGNGTHYTEHCTCHANKLTGGGWGRGGTPACTGLGPAIVAEDANEKLFEQLWRLGPVIWQC